MLLINPSNSPNPLVSIIIPFFNQKLFLAEAIESVLNQSYKNWELLLIDDGSTDESPVISQNFVNQFPEKIFLFSQPDKKNRGASNARNIGVKNARGNFITFLDSDDVLLPESIEKELLALENNPQADAVCGGLEFWFSWDNETKKSNSDFKVNLGLPPEKLYHPPTLLVHNLRANGRKPGINCIMLTRKFIDSIGRFEDDFQYVSEDQVFWAKVSLNGKIFVTDECLAKYRQHKNSSVAVIIENKKETENWNAFLDWLENYLKEKEIQDQEVWNSLKSYRNKIKLQAKFGFCKNLYRRLFPLQTRYWVRDLLINWKQPKK